MRKIKVSGGFLNSRLGKRIFARILLIVMLPLCVVSVLSYELTDIILRQSTERVLQESGKSIILNLLDRLRSAEGLLKAYGEASEKGQENDSLKERLRVVFASVEIVHLSVTSPPEAKESRLRIQQKDSESAPVATIELQLPDGRGLVIGRLDTDYLWENLQSGIYNVCLSGAGIKSSYCLHKDERNGRVIEATRALHFRPFFDAPSWSLTTIASPRIGQFLPVAPGEILAAVAFVGLIIALIATSIVLRRTTRPLDQLMLATKAVREGRYGHIVPLAEMTDEFRELAVSLNAMTGEVGADLRFLQVLSRIDDAILQREEIRAVIKSILLHLNSSGSGATASVVIWDYTQSSPNQLKYEIDKGLVENLAPSLLVDVKQADAGIATLTVESSCEMSIPVARTEQRSVWLLLQRAEELAEFSSRTLKESAAFSARMAVALHADQRERQLIARAAHDSLTGLFNRLGLVESIDSLLLSPINGFSVSFLDLDGFKDVNDAYGHDVGDRLLKEVAKRISSVLQPEALALARLGGDEFVFVLPADDEGHFRRKVGAVLHEIQLPFAFDETEIIIGASIGTALFPQHGRDHDDLLRNADLAMYQSKASGRNRITEFEVAANSASAERIELRRDLGRALGAGQFFLVYQPRVHAVSGVMHSVEALIRWRHPERGLISPDKFISLAEDSGLIVEIGFWVVEESFRQFNAWRAAGDVNIAKISVNISPVQLTHAGFLEGVETLMQEYDMPASAIEFEVTEGALIRDVDAAVAKLTYLQRLGFDIALDDFGVGYSAMSYLSILPFNTLKIDKSFVAAFGKQQSAYAIAAAIVALAKALGKRVVAEGVETQSQADLLVQLGVDELQGYLFSPPVPPDQVATALIASTD